MADIVICDDREEILKDLEAKTEKPMYRVCIGFLFVQPWDAYDG